MATGNSNHQPSVENSKEASNGLPLGDFVSQLEDYRSTIPDGVTAWYLKCAGFETTDPRMVRMISLAAQKFISDLAKDSLSHCKMRGASVNKKNSKEKKYTLSLEDLNPVMQEYGIVAKKPPYHT